MLLKQFGLVKGVGFQSWRRVGPVLPAVKVYNRREVDELVILDIIAHEAAEGIDYDMIDEFSRDCFVPLTVGGGIRTLSQVQKLLSIGADKVTVNSALFDYPGLVSDIAKAHGSQCVIASIDARPDGAGRWQCFSQAGRNATGKFVEDWAREMEDRGAGEILVTSIERDGTMLGYDLALIEHVVNAVNIPVIASGGAGNYQHMVDAIEKSGASAVAAASMFHFTEQTPAGAKEALQAAGIPVRPPFFSRANSQLAADLATCE